MRRFGVRSAGVLAAVAMASVTFVPVARAAVPAPFAWRGIIEGFYGKPYSHADRMDLLRWEEAHGMNTFVNAAKEDEYVRTSWRESYPAAQISACGGSPTSDRGFP
jgi:hyaluronoglucosaminidase